MNESVDGQKNNSNNRYHSNDNDRSSNYTADNGIALQPW